ncbi:hypothetical protein R3P38DRAFT_3177303 [Favolaschia claudopus]|uniref:DUF6533 domain-containing protein n=1 Tax=Favolaschia claudopus TaxID=2862362 RepID=A0AAW0D389_9AGAR
MSAKAIQAATTHFLQFRLQYSSLALLYYDYALTFPREVKYIWQERFRVSTALYIGCRYALIANVLYLLAIANKLGSTYAIPRFPNPRTITLTPGAFCRCDSWYKIVGALSILGRVVVIAVFVMRTYAVYGKNKWVLAYMSLVGLMCIALDIAYCISGASPRSPQLPSHLIFSISTISIFTMAAVILNYRAPPGFFQRLPNAFTLPLSCILVARFILHLREWDAEQIGAKSHATDISVAEFRAASRSGGVLSDILAIDDFGGDLVEEARRPSLELRVIKRLRGREGEHSEDDSEGSISGRAGNGAKNEAIAMAGRNEIAPV